MSSIRSSRALLLVLVAILFVSGCQIGVSTRTTDADSIEDLEAEERYKSVYVEHMNRLHEDFQLLAPTETSPGVCNAGGTKQGCYDADAKIIASLQNMLDALNETEVPPRYEEADALLREAIQTDIQGLSLRNQGIANNDDAAFQQHKIVLQDALEMFAQAYELFPEDNRPVPAP